MFRRVITIALLMGCYTLSFAQSGVWPETDPFTGSSGAVAVDTFRLAAKSNSQLAEGMDRLWTIGVSIGTSFTYPWLIGTARGTLAPFRNSFFEIGLDFGLISGVKDVGHYSLCPFAHYSYYMPFSGILGWYAGAGGGYTFAVFNYPTGKVHRDSFIFDLVTGFNIINILDVSYTLRTNFVRVSNKISVGYIYRFRSQTFKKK